MIYNIYCDESCHLPNDKFSFMSLGLIKCPLENTKDVSLRLKEIKQKHGLSYDFEMKWNKVSISKVNFYLDIIDYFFDDDDLMFRGLIADKSNLNHESYSQSHDDWYYKMIFLLMKPILSPQDKFRIYLDKKDTRGADKVRKLHEVLGNSVYDFDRNIVERLQVIESHHVQLLQLVDILLGAMGYHARDLDKNEGKIILLNRIKQRSGYNLDKSTLPSEGKFNIFYWKGS